MGWTTVGGPVPEKKCVILGVPHTSAWDFVISYLFYTQFDRVAHVMIKREFFVGPVGWFLRKVGCIPVDRSSASSMLFSLINEMEKVDTFHLAIAPEGTRHAVKKWKTVNGRNTLSGKTVKLAADLDMTGIDYVPAGNTIASYPSTAFAGVFDGQGHTISNLSVASHTGQISPGSKR